MAIKDDKLWLVEKYTKMPNELMEYLCKDPSIPVRVRVIILICRLSYGFHKKKTNKRLCNGEIADLIIASEVSVWREIKALITEKRLFKLGQQGAYAFYSLSPLEEDISDSQYESRNLKSERAGSEEISNLKSKSATETCNANRNNELSTMRESVNLVMQSLAVKKDFKENGK